MPVPMHSAISAVIWPLSGLRRRRVPSGRVSKYERCPLRPPTPSGTNTQNAAYSSTPSPSPHRNSPRNASRTQSTGIPMCPASPRATPPSMRPSALR